MKKRILTFILSLLLVITTACSGSTTGEFNNPNSEVKLIGVSAAVHVEDEELKKPYNLSFSLDNKKDDEEDDDDSDDDEDDEDEEEDEPLTGEALAKMDFEELEDVCDDKDLDTDPDDFDEDEIEKFRKEVAKELGLKLPKAAAKGKGKKGKK